jgi:DNA-binding response OmpR family regulator
MPNEGARMTGHSLPGKILVVDDDRLVLATVVHGLSEAGYVVIDADNGDDAILLAREHRPDLALLDIRMEGKSGFDVAAYLREYLQTPFMFLSAFADAETTAKVRELGAVAYLVKPLDIRQIVPAVEAAFVQIRAKAASVSVHPGEAAEVDAELSKSLRGDAVDSPGLDNRVAMAVGVLMHRYSINRGDALTRLETAALEERQDLDTHAEAVLKAVEILSLPSRR